MHDAAHSVESSSRRMKSSDNRPLRIANCDFTTSRVPSLFASLEFHNFYGMLLTHEIAYCMHDINPSRPGPPAWWGYPSNSKKSSLVPDPQSGLGREPDLGERFRVAVTVYKVIEKMASAEVSLSPALGDSESGMSAGEFVLKKLFAEFVAVSDRRLQHIATQSLVRRSLVMLLCPNLGYLVDVRQRCS